MSIHLHRETVQYAMQTQPGRLWRASFVQEVKLDFSAKKHRSKCLASTPFPDVSLLQVHNTF